MLHQIRRGARRAKRSAVNLAACSMPAANLALSVGAKTLTAGVNLSHLDTYREMLQAGFKTTRQGVAMHRNGDPGYHRPDVFLIDDWR